MARCIWKGSILDIKPLLPTLVGWHSSPGAWCVNELLGHFIGTDRRGFGVRLHSMLNSADPRLCGLGARGAGTPLTRL